MTVDAIGQARALIGRPIGASFIGGVPVDDVTTTEVVDLIDAFVTEGRTTGRTFQVATVNVDFIMNAKLDPAVQRILQRAELCIPDGMPIVWHARVAGTPLRERVTGADVVPLLIARAMKSGWRVVLFGSAPGVAERAARVLSLRYPGAEVIGLSGPFVADVTEFDRGCIEELSALAADVICVALGNPKQERFIDAFRSELGAPVLLGVGGTLDFIVGGRRRAPTVLQKLGLEWVYRAAQEPRRLGQRYARNAVGILPEITRSAWGRARRDQTPARVAVVVGAARDARRRGEPLTSLPATDGMAELVRNERLDGLFMISGRVPDDRADE